MIGLLKIFEGVQERGMRVFAALKSVVLVVFMIVVWIDRFNLSHDCFQGRRISVGGTFHLRQLRIDRFRLAYRVDAILAIAVNFVESIDNTLFSGGSLLDILQPRSIAPITI